MIPAGIPSPRVGRLGPYLPESVKAPIRPLYWGAVDVQRYLGFVLARDTVVETDYGVKLRVNQHDFAERRFANQEQVAEKTMISYFTDLVSSDYSSFVDVGANIGMYVLLFQDGHPAPEETTVHAFEPLHRNLRRLSENLRCNGFSEDSVDLHRVALSDQAREMTIEHAPWNYGSASLAENGHHVLTRSESVECRKLDDYARRISDIDLVKVDVEGWELRVFEGAGDVLGSDTPELLVELHPEAMNAVGDSVEDLFQYLSDSGYESVTRVEDRQTLHFSRSSPEAVAESVEGSHAVHITA